MGLRRHAVWLPGTVVIGLSCLDKSVSCSKGSGDRGFIPDQSWIVVSRIPRHTVDGNIRSIFRDADIRLVAEAQISRCSPQLKSVLTTHALQ